MSKTLLLLEWERYSELFNIKPNRERHNIVCRFAFMVSSRRAFTTKQIGAVMNKDHATVIHAAKCHEMNLKFDSEYQKMFEVTEALIDGIVTSDDYQSQNNKIDTLLENIKLRLLVNSKSYKIAELETKLYEYELCD